MMLSTSLKPGLSQSRATTLLNSWRQFMLPKTAWTASSQSFRKKCDNATMARGRRRECFQALLIGYLSVIAVDRNLLNMVTLRTQLLLSCLFLRLLTFDCIMPVLCGPIASFDDNCGVHSRPYHSSVGRDACQGVCFGRVHTLYSQK